MSGLFGPPSRPVFTPFDLSVLGGYYLAKANARAISAGAAVAHPPKNDSGKFTPWAQKADDPSSVARLKDALTATSFVDVRDSAYDSANIPADQKKLFALYKGLSRLQALASRAGYDETPLAELTGLNRRFTAGFDEIKSYIREYSFDDLTLLLGTRSSRVDSGLKIARPPSKYVGPSIVGGAASNVVPGLAGNEVFTASVAKSGGTIDVTMDMSQLGGDLSLSNVITYMNSQMAAAGVSTRFVTNIFDGKTASDPKRYGIGVQTVATERVSFAAAATSPALYLGGVSGAGASQTGQLMKLTDDGASPSTDFTASIASKTGVADVRATATDADGNVFIVGTVTGDLGSGIVQGAQDVYLRKYDAAGQLIWSRLLGSSERADGYAIATDADGNVAIAGKVTDRLTSTAIGGGDDTFVTKYGADGHEVFTRQIAPLLDDQANALAFASDGSLFVAGQTKSAMSAGVTHNGGSDAYLMKLSSSGSLTYARQFGGSGDDRATAVTVDSSGDVILGTVEAGEAKVRKLLGSDGTSDPVWEVSLGALGQGNLSSLAVDAGAIYVAGATDNAALTAGGQASIVAAHSGGSDGFVMKIADAGASASASFISYVGTSGSDSAAGVAVANGAVYVAGSTNGAFNGGAAPSKTNAYVAKLDGTGAQVWAHQFESTAGSASVRSLAVDAQGGSVLDKLGLPRGAIAFDETRLISAASSVRAGDYFSARVNGGTTFKITVSATDTMRSLTTKINAALVLKGEATLMRSGGDGVRITAKEGNVIELIPGAEGFDALAGLGLDAGKLDNTKDHKPVGATAKDINVFGLGLDDAPVINDKLKAKTLTYQLAAALETIKSAYQTLTHSAQKAASPNAQRATAAYQSILAALGG